MTPEQELLELRIRDIIVNGVGNFYVRAQAVGLPVGTMAGAQAQAGGLFDACVAQPQDKPGMLAVGVIARQLLYCLGIMPLQSGTTSRRTQMAYTTAHKAKLKSLGCPDDCCDKLEAYGAGVEDVAKLATLGTINWQALLALLAQYGPQILAVILSLFGQTPTPPVPVP